MSPLRWQNPPSLPAGHRCPPAAQSRSCHMLCANILKVGGKNCIKQPNRAGCFSQSNPSFLRPLKGLTILLPLFGIITRAPPAD